MYFDIKNLDAIGPGSIITHRSNGKAYIVTAVYDGRITAVRTIDITNPSEWRLYVPIKDGGSVTQFDKPEIEGPGFGKKGD